MPAVVSTLEILFVRGPRMGLRIRGCWICIFGAPRFSVQRPQNPYLEGFRSDLGRPQRRSNDHSRTVSNATLADATWVFLIFCLILFSMVGVPANKKSAFTKAASIPARQQTECRDPKLFGFLFRRCPPSWMYFPIFRAQHESGKFAKAAFGTLWHRSNAPFSEIWFCASLWGSQASRDRVESP